MILKKLRITTNNTKAFFKEVFILTKILKHPGVIKILKYFKSSKYYYIIYEFFEGEPVVSYFTNN